MNIEETIMKIARTHEADEDELKNILADSSHDQLLFEQADKVRREVYGDKVYIRGLIEITNYCRNNCLYCGIRHGNSRLKRYRLTPEKIYLCCDEGYALGFRTFVLQGGDDKYYTDELLCRIVENIKKKHPDCAVTLSLGERSAESYKRLFDSGTDRYLLRHETADKKHYEQLHPAEMSFENRIKCLFVLKRTGFQTGAGFMVGSPYQTYENIVKDLVFVKNLKPEMVGIGPFIPHRATPFRDMEEGSLRDTLAAVALTRLLLPNALIPATTALGTLSPQGRSLGLKAGANVLMPNLTPEGSRKLYSLYNNKLSSGVESAQNIAALEKSVEEIGYKIVTDRGDFIAE